MALRFSPLANMTGPDGLIQQPVTPDYSILAKKLHEAQRALVAPDTANADRPGYQTQVNDLQRALVASKDQSRLDQLPPGPMPPPGDVTVIEKGAVQERPPSSFGTLATEDQIMQAFQRRQQQAAPPEMMVAEAPTPMVKPQAPKPQPTAVDMANMQGGAPAPAPQTAMAYQAPAQSTGGVSFAPNTEQRGISLGANAAMQKLEHSWGRPFTVTSAYRSPEHNAKVGGAKHSQHLHGNAFDISTDGWTEADKQAFVDQALAAGFNGIGVYPNSLHIDVGNRRAWGPSYGSESAPEWAIAKVNGAPATDQNWITGGESAQPSALAFNAEDGMQPSAGGPQDGLMRLLSAMRQPQAEPQGQYVPMEQPQAYTEVAQGSQPIVAPGSNVKPVSFSGDGAGAIRSPEQIDNTRQLAAALMSPGAQRVDHPLQGVAQVANAAAGAYGMYRADQQEQQRSNALAQALQGYYNGGNADALAAVAPNLYARVMEQRQSRQAAEQQAQQQRQASREDYVWKKGIDQQYASPPEQPNDVQEYEYARQQMLEAGTPPDQIPDYTTWSRGNAKSGASNVTVGGGKYGTIPQGYELVEGDGGASMRPIPGGPAAQEQEAAQRQEAGRQQMQQATGNLIVEDIGRAYEMASESPFWTTGIVGGLMSNVGGSQARDLRGLITTIGANISFGELQKMRDNSPTGGALGQVTPRELELLQATKGDIEQSQSEQQFLYNLARLGDMTLDVVHGPTWRETSPQLSIFYREAQKAVANGKDPNAVNDRLQRLGLPPLGGQ